MRRLFKVCICIGGWVTVSVFCLLVAPPTTNAWSGTEIVTLNSRHTNESYAVELQCPGYNSIFQLGRNAIIKQGCIFGTSDKARVVRYLNDSGVYRYAVARLNESVFHTLEGVCEGMNACAYSPQTDTLLMQSSVAPNGRGHVVVKDFFNHLHYTNENEGFFRYDFKAPSTLVGYGNHQLQTGSVALSSNGDWAIVEAHEYGFVRINLRDGTMRRVIAPGATYGLGTDPTFELAISNTGQYVAVVGLRAGLDVYEVTNTCGDILRAAMSKVFDSAVTPCLASSIDRYTLFPGFVTAHLPRFSANGKKLSLYVTTQSSRLISVIAPRHAQSSGNVSYYRAYGDSFTSGEGELSDVFYKEGTNTLTNRCHVSTRSYPYLLGESWAYVADNRACSGSTTKDVQELQLKSIDDQTQEGDMLIASIGVGGNDINLMSKLKTCLGLGTCEWAKAGNRLSSSLEIQSLFPKLTELIATVKYNYPETNWFVVGYPSVINATREAHCSSIIAAMLDATERQYMEESVKLLNSVLRSAAHSAHTRYVDIEDALQGERLCDTVESSMNAIRMGDDIAPIVSLQNLKLIGSESFHPTPKGQHKMATAIKRQLDNNWQEEGCRECLSIIEPSSYWTEQREDGSLFQQISQKFIQAKKIISGMKVSYSFPSGTFLSNTVVRFELHSTPIQLAEAKANEDGSLFGELLLPSGIIGYHTVHAFGQNNYDQAVDLYEILSISEELLAARPSMENQNNLNTQSLNTELSSSATVPGSKAVNDNKERAALPLKVTDSLASSGGNKQYWIATIGVLLLMVTLAFIVYKMQKNNRG